MKKVLHIITGLGSGGAEGVLYRLCTHDKDNQHLVISFMSDGKYGALLREAGVEVYCLQQSQGKFTIKAVLRLYKLINTIKPDIVQTWMYHADLIGGLIAKISGINNIHWNIRHSSLIAGKSKKSTILIAKICALLSYIIPKNIVCCAKTALDTHASLGYSAKRMTVISNGYDVLALNELALEEPPLEITNVEQYTPIIGLIGRYNIQKNHSGFFSALSMLTQSGNHNFKVVLVGHGVDSNNTDLLRLLESKGLVNKVILLGEQNNVPSILSKFDLSVLPSSFGEGFPNVVAESMALGIPCIVTDVGDAARIVGDTGWIIPPNDDFLLSKTIAVALEELSNDSQQWVIRKSKAKTRVTENFSLDLMVKKYKEAWSS
ncbi:glycosyltransferase [Pseudoalteromonas sp. EB27]|uniref:glycosyltransferase family 4 protein n=1 Tax=Pseudoalteromonas sp. EB27 TaxID=1938368 RepID=UPI0009773231|nr:glycosyltransferase [Pseudoalteromonas sp. EB27]